MKREGSVSVGFLPMGNERGSPHGRVLASPFSQGRLSASPTPNGRVSPCSASVVQLKMTGKGIYTAGFGPFIKRRPVTSYSEHHSFAPSPSARIKSAALNMPRSHVSVARFYDWSEDLGDCVSVSQFYRDLAAYNKLQSNNKSKDKSRAVNPGRMFLRDKAGLTKGEREIIEGIYRNRCTNGKDDLLEDSKEDWHLVKSHKDAWLIGKHIHRGSPNRSDSDGKSDLTSSPTDSCSCNKNEDHGEGAHAPPTTPDPLDHEDHSNHLWKRKNAHKSSRGHPLDIIDSRHYRKSSRDTKEKKKLYVNVFLPTISGDGIKSPHDSLNAQLTLPSTDGPRHPLFSEHARNIFREKQEKARFSRLHPTNGTHSLSQSSTIPLTNQ